MRITRLFVGNVSSDSGAPDSGQAPLALAAAQRVALPTTLYHRLAHVLRMQVGDTLHVFDGVQPMDFSAVLCELSAKSVVVATQAALPRATASPFALHLWQGLARWDTMDWVVQKAVELGVHAITPVQTQHSQMRVNARKAAARLAQWQQIAIHAAEQSGRSFVPQIAPITAWSQLHLESTQDAWLWYGHDSRSVATHRGGDVRVATFEGSPKVLHLCIGPEGGYSAEELSQLHAWGGHALSLGPRVLRTETASVAALSLCQWRFGDLKSADK